MFGFDALGFNPVGTKRLFRAFSGAHRQWGVEAHIDWDRGREADDHSMLSDDGPGRGGTFYTMM